VGFSAFQDFWGRQFIVEKGFWFKAGVPFRFISIRGVRYSPWSVVRGPWHEKSPLLADLQLATDD